MTELLVTLSIYLIPNGFHLDERMWWVHMGSCSMVYVLLLYSLCKSDLRIILVGIECVCLACVTTAFLETRFSGSQSFVSANITDIIQYCFLAELAVALGGIAIGTYHRIFRYRRDVPAPNPTDDRFIRFGETNLCPNL